MTDTIQGRFGRRDEIEKELELSTRRFSNTQKEILISDYLNILSYHYEFDSDTSGPKQNTTEIKSILGELADLVVDRSNPNDTIYKQIEKLDALWEIKRDSHNAATNDEIQALTIDRDNEIAAYKKSEPGASLDKISDIEAKINSLRATLI